MSWKALHLGEDTLIPKNVGIIALLLLLLAVAIVASWLLTYVYNAMDSPLWHPCSMPHSRSIFLWPITDLWAQVY